MGMEGLQQRRMALEWGNASTGVKSKALSVRRLGAKFWKFGRATTQWSLLIFNSQPVAKDVKERKV